jgi:DNA-binding LacI/PurR family transcriptional regulator
MPHDGKFGRLVRKHRIDRGLNQDELAERVGYTGGSRHSIISKIETAARREVANPEQVSRLIHALHEERNFTLPEINQLATSYLGLEDMSASRERLQLAVVIAGVAFSSFWSSVIANLAIIAGQWYNLALRTHGEDLGSEQEILRSLVDRAHSLHGVILAPAQGLYRGPSARQMEIRRDLVRQLQERDVPVVLLDRWLTDADQAALRVRAPVVSVDHYDAGRKAVRKLCEAGHRRIGVLLDMAHCQTQQERCRGALDEMHAQGIDVDRRLIVFGTAGPKVDPSALGDSPFGFHNIRMNTSALIGGREGSPAPTALLCTTSYVTIEAYTAIVRDRRLKIPDQISLLGFDDVNELRRLGISRVPYRPSDAAKNALDKIGDYHDPVRKIHAYRDHFWHVSYADADWDIATYEEPGTVRDIHEPLSTDDAHQPFLAQFS